MDHAYRGRLQRGLVRGLGAVHAHPDAPPDYQAMPFTLQWSPGLDGERADLSRWSPCHGCGHAIPARRDRVEAGAELRELDTCSYVCPHCDATQLGSAENSVDRQVTCHGCDGALDGGAACGGCGMLRGWAVGRCRECGHHQAVCMPHLASMCDAFKLECVRCEAVTVSLCIC